MPSFNPLSTLMVCLIFKGTSSLVTTANPRAASVGDRISAINASNQMFSPGNNGIANNTPITIVIGKPINNRRIGNLLSFSNDFIFKVEASINRIRTSVTSATIFTQGAVIPDFKISLAKRLPNNPIVTKTMGAEIADFAESFEKAPNIKINRAVNAIMG